MDDAHSICLCCGKQLNSSDKRKMYCSQKCKLAAWKSSNKDRCKELRIREYKARKIPEYSRVSSGYCIRCGSPYCGQNKNKHCSNECRNATCRDKYSTYKDTDTKKCKRCGNTFTPNRTNGKKSDYCSDECSEISYAAHKRTGNAKRRALCKGVDAESVNPFIVFDRDKWKCKLCGCNTPRSKRGTYYDDAPELDHIIPLAEGGSHTYKNTQCACRKCNGIKGNKPLGQMLLIG